MPASNTVFFPQNSPCRAGRTCGRTGKAMQPRRRQDTQTIRLDLSPQLAHVLLGVWTQIWCEPGGTHSTEVRKKTDQEWYKELIQVIESMDTRQSTLLDYNILSYFQAHEADRTDVGNALFRLSSFKSFPRGEHGASLLACSKRHSSIMFVFRFPKAMAWPSIFPKSCR